MLLGRGKYLKFIHPLKTKMKPKKRKLGSDDFPFYFGVMFGFYASFRGSILMLQMRYPPDRHEKKQKKHEMLRKLP